jgi:hypothetical protein
VSAALKCYTHRLKGLLEAKFRDSSLRRHPDSNRGMEVLQTSALPLGYAAKKNGAGNGI